MKLQWTQVKVQTKANRHSAKVWASLWVHRLIYMTSAFYNSLQALPTQLYNIAQVSKNLLNRKVSKWNWFMDFAVTCNVLQVLIGLIFSLPGNWEKDWKSMSMGPWTPLIQTGRFSMITETPVRICWRGPRGIKPSATWMGRLMNSSYGNGPSPPVRSSSTLPLLSVSTCTAGIIHPLERCWLKGSVCRICVHCTPFSYCMWFLEAGKVRYECHWSAQLSLDGQSFYPGL